MNTIENSDQLKIKQNKEHFMDLVQVALADGRMDQKEYDLLLNIGKKMRFTASEISDLFEWAKKDNIIPPQDLSNRFRKVYNVVKMILADAVIDKSEMRLAQIFAARSGFSDTEIPSLLLLLINGIKQGKNEEVLFEDFKKGRNK